MEAVNPFLEGIQSFLGSLLPFMKGLTVFEAQALWVTLGVALVSIGYAWLLRRQVLRQDAGAVRLPELWDAVRQAASIYLSRQFRALSVLMLLLAFALAASVWFIPPTREAIERFGQQEARLWVAIGRALAFLVGTLFAYAAGAMGMNDTVASNVRVAAAASKGYNPALQVAYKASAATGMLTMGLGLLGSTLIIMIFGFAAVDVLIGFAAGISLTVLLMRVGGGIYTAAADGGADLSARGEEGLPTDDARNVATVAVLVGSGARGAGAAVELFESLEIALIAALMLGLALGDLLVGVAGDGLYERHVIIFPLLLYGIGVLSSLIGHALVRTDDRRRNARAAINRGFYIAAALALAGFTALAVYYLVGLPALEGDWRPYCAAFAGVLMTIVLFKLTEFFTSTLYDPVKAVGRASRTGPDTSVTAGLSLGFESGVWLSIIVAGAILSAASIYRSEPTQTLLIAILYAIAMTSVGILSLSGHIVALAGFGAVTESAGSVNRIAALDKNPRNVIEDLEAVGNSTRAAARGIVAGSAALAVIGLFGAFAVFAGRVQDQAGLQPLAAINLLSPLVLIGLLVGGTLPLLLSSFLLRAVRRVADQVATTARKQFNRPDVMQGAETPDYAYTVNTSSAAAQAEFWSAAAVGLLAPLLVGLLLGLEALGGFLIGFMLCGLLLAALQSTMGDAWANARKYIEDGFYGGKNSEAHRAALISDRAGRSLRDAAGVSLGPMLKLAGVVALVVAPIIVAHPLPGGALGPAQMAAMLVSLVVLGLLFWRSRYDAAGEAKPKKSTPRKTSQNKPG